MKTRLVCQNCPPRAVYSHVAVVEYRRESVQRHVRQRRRVRVHLPKRCLLPAVTLSRSFPFGVGRSARRTRWTPTAWRWKSTKRHDGPVHQSGASGCADHAMNITLERRDEAVPQLHGVFSLVLNIRISTRRRAVEEEECHLTHIHVQPGDLGNTPSSTTPYRPVARAPAPESTCTQDAGPHRRVIGPQRPRDHGGPPEAVHGARREPEEGISTTPPTPGR